MPVWNGTGSVFSLLIAGSLTLPLLAAPPVVSAVKYDPSGRLVFPSEYRQWVFLGSGLGLTYGPLAERARTSPPLFDNVFVNPEAYRAFLETGHWQDKTVFILEVRASQSHASINQDGHFQTGIVGIEAEVKDKSAPSGEWTFYGFENLSRGAMPAAKAIGREASCYSCHETNTAVENTFVQFYPDLYQVALKKGTLNHSFKPLPSATADK